MINIEEKELVLNDFMGNTLNIALHSDTCESIPFKPGMMIDMTQP